MHKKLSRTLSKGVCKFKSIYTCKSLISYDERSKVVWVDKVHFSHRASSAGLAESNSNTARNITNLLSHTGLQTQMAKMGSSDVNLWRLSDYDCVGFDLDNTICRYKLTSMIKLEYEVLSKYLVSQKGYNPDYLLQPLETNIDFIKKGLILDFVRGNVLQIRFDGYIAKASHGTHFLSNSEIEEIYGQNRKWDVAVEFTHNMLEAWNGPLSEKIRTLLDYFDMPASLAFARIVDSLDNKEGKPSSVYNVWPDVLEGLIYMFQRENFAANSGDYFPALKADPDLYINKCSKDVLKWLQSIKDTKLVFLITGSNVDFASFTAEHSLGENWRNLFDIVVCYARKPGFFTGMRPFIKLDGLKETDPIDGKDLEIGNMYSQGNWQDLYQLFRKMTEKKTPKCVYIGDNLIQDIYTPSEYTKCDTVAIVEELSAEGMKNYSDFHEDTKMLVSECWGSYFCCNDKETLKSNIPTLWGEIINKRSQICVPNLDIMANHPLNFGYCSFVINEYEEQLGYYPSCPASLTKVT